MTRYLETILDSPNSYNFIRIGGQFYNRHSSGTTKDGDIIVELRRGDLGKQAGYEAKWTAAEVIVNGDTTEYSYFDDGTIIAAGGIGHETNRIEISYDNDRTFTFTVNETTTSFTGPDKRREPIKQRKIINTTISTENSVNKGYTQLKLTMCLSTEAIVRIYSTIFPQLP